MEGDRNSVITPEELLPIDIYYNKLLDWLLDRRHCDVKWQGAVLEIREKINSAIQDMPAVDEITKLLSGTYINYFHCLRIVELLKVSEASSKNIFGGYSSKRMKDWQEIVRLYEKDNVHLAEAAHLLLRNVNYDIPALKRQIGKCQQTQRDCTRKESEYTANAAMFKEKYHTVCKQMGIKGDRVRAELLNLLNELPDVYESVTKQTKNLDAGVEYYEAFVKFVTPSYDAAGEDKSRHILPLLKHIQQHGNTTVYQWQTGKVPLTVVRPETCKDEDTEETKVEDHKENNDNSSEIDWGGLATEKGEQSSELPTKGDDVLDWGDDGATGETIDWGDSGETGETIDWEDSGNDSGAIDLGESGDGGDIDWGEQNGETTGISLEESGEASENEGLASGTDALNVLENTDTRNLFIDELLELEAFITQRLAEMSKDVDVLSVNQFQSAPRILQIQTAVTVKEMKAAISHLLESFTSVRMHNLFLLKSSPRYLDRLVDSLQQKLRTAEKLLCSCKTMAEKRQAAVKQQSELEPKLDVIREKTKVLQSQISQEISKKYKNRRVNIMGEINSI